MELGVGFCFLVFSLHIVGLWIFDEYEREINKIKKGYFTFEA